MKFMGGQYFYADPMDFMWWDDARMRITKYSSETYSMMISAEGAMGFYFGNCDAYGPAKSDVGTSLAQQLSLTLKVMMPSKVLQLQTYIIVLLGTGGITNGWFWGALYGQRNLWQSIGLNYGHPNVWSTWDNYFGNTPFERYSGATTYTNEQADASNAEIALWSTDGAFSGITHGSIRLTGNNHPHGYDWESKAGENYRFFHPMNALENFNQDYYGNYLGYGGILHTTEMRAKILIHIIVLLTAILLLLCDLQKV